MRPADGFWQHVLASAVGAALLVPYDFSPWWTVMILQLPPWTWPILGALVAWFIYSWGVRAGAVRLSGTAEVGPIVSTAALSVEKKDQVPSLVEPVVGISDENAVPTAASLHSMSTAEVERVVAIWKGRAVTATGTLTSVTHYSDSDWVLVTMNVPTTNDYGVCFVGLKLPADKSSISILKALAPGLLVSVAGKIESIGPGVAGGGDIDLEECELLRIGR